MPPADIDGKPGLCLDPNPRSKTPLSSRTRLPVFPENISTCRLAMASGQWGTPLVSVLIIVYPKLNGTVGQWTNNYQNALPIG